MAKIVTAFALTKGYSKASIQCDWNYWGLWNLSRIMCCHKHPRLPLLDGFVLIRITYFAFSLAFGIAYVKTKSRRAPFHLFV